MMVRMAGVPPLQDVPLRHVPHVYMYKFIVNMRACHCIGYIIIGYRLIRLYRQLYILYSRYKRTDITVLNILLLVYLYWQTCVLLSIYIGCVIKSSEFISMKNYINDIYTFFGKFRIFKDRCISIP